MSDGTVPEVALLTGQCVCGTVRYTVPDAVGYAFHCHCVDRRRAAGAAFKSFAGIERTLSVFTAGANHPGTRGSSDAHDVRCAECGSFLLSVVRGGGRVHVALGT